MVRCGRATKQALVQEMNFQGTPVASESENRFDSGTMRAMTTSGGFGSDLFYYLTIKPVGSETIRDHDVCIRVTEIQSEAPQGVAITKSRRTDIERQMADRVIGLLAANAPPVEGSENQ